MVARVGYADPMRHVHLTHPRLDFWVTVEIHERDGRFMATADLAEDSQDVEHTAGVSSGGAAEPGRAVCERNG